MQEGRLILRAAMRCRSQRRATACSGSAPLIAKMTNPEETRRSVWERTVTPGVSRSESFKDPARSASCGVPLVRHRL